jgi:hypothetical protein
MQPDMSRADWVKSSHSGPNGNCVETARNMPGLVAVRDSKDPTGPRWPSPPESGSASSRGSGAALR